MPSAHLHEQAKAFAQPRPEIRPGYTVRVHERIQEGNKERIQVFEGLVIAVHKGSTPADSTFTVRRIASGVGVERVFALLSPKIEKIEVKKVAKVRRAKLFFLRGRTGKAARLSERFTKAEEFAVAIPEPVEEEAPAEEEVQEPPVEENAKADEGPTESDEVTDAKTPAEEVKADVDKEVSAEKEFEEKKEKEE